MKRYAIVRVDNNCPFMQEKLDFSSCSKMFNCDKFIRCEKCEHNCRYGDTKEQLIRKVATAMKRAVKKATKKNIFIVCDEEKIPICIFIENVLAKEIVEFLGVE